MSELIELNGATDRTAERAQTGFDEVHRNPVAAAAALRDVLADPLSTSRALAIAWWGMARLDYDAGRVEEALTGFAAALDVALRAGLTEEPPQIRMSWSLTLVAAGDREAALAQLALAEPEVQGARLGRMLTQRASLLTTIGDTDGAVADYERALTLLRADNDELGEIRLLNNRAVALLQVGRTREARRDLVRAMAMAQRSEQHVLVAHAAHNLGYLDFLLGRVPKALGAFALARRLYEGLGSPGRINAALDTDECTVLLAAGFPHEAQEIAERLIDDATASGNALQLAEGRLLLARSLTMLRDHDEALTRADQAAALFRATGRAPWAAMAEYVGAMALADGDPDGAIERLRAAADTLRSLGWQAEAAEVQVRLGVLALRTGQTDVARRALADAAIVGRRAAARTRAAAWHATALLHVLDERPVSARRAIRAGLRVVDVYRAALGASDLRARASADGVELAALGLRLALATGRPADVLLAAERWRAGALASRAATIAGEASVDHDLAELRRLGSEVRGVGGSEPAAPAAAAMRAELLRLERQITAVTRLAPGDPRAVGGRLDLRRLRAELGEATLVEYIDVDGKLTAAVVTSSRTRLVPLADRERVLRLVEHLTFEIRRLSSLPRGHPRAALAIASYRRSAAELAAMLVTPLRIREGPLVIVPTGPLHSLPWSALPGLQRADGVTVAPSAAWWMGSAGDWSAADQVLLVHGPDLPYAAAELRAIRDIVSGTTELAGEAATTQQVLDAMATSGLVHIAAHGSFRADNPMFSSLQLADGPLYVHDLQRLTRTPHTVILTACNAGRSGVYGGDELLGTGVALLALGVRSVIAPLLPVRDESTAPFAVDIHRALARGATPPEALGIALVRASDADDPGLLAAAASFQCVSRKVG